MWEMKDKIEELDGEYKQDVDMNQIKAPAMKVLRSSRPTLGTVLCLDPAMLEYKKDGEIFVGA